MNLNREQRRTRNAARPKGVYPQHAQPKRIALDVCAHLGERVPGQPCGSQLMRCDLHNEITTRFTKCSAATRHCATCPDNTTKPKPVADPWNDYVTVPRPPEWTGVPRSQLALVTAVVGDIGERMWAETRAGFEEYARRIGADLIVLRWPGNSRWPMSAKFGLAPILARYDRAIWADADVVFRPGCHNLFDRCRSDEVGGWSDLADVLGVFPGFVEEYNRTREAMGFAKAPVPFYLNTGVLVLSRQHRPLVEIPDRPIPPLHCAEQHLWNARIHARGARVKLLDAECNWQWWARGKLESPVPPRAVIHVSGWSGSFADRVATIAKWARDKGAEPLARIAPPNEELAWEIDARHLEWIYSTLASGRFRRVLEIGSFQGYSAQSFIKALQTGAVDEVHLCELRPTPQLQQRIAESGVTDRITLHTCPSTELLARDTRWDLVFVDGDHSPGTVLAETRLLLAAGTRAVFAHDTSAAGRYEGCEGPQYLKAMFTAAGYHCFEDAMYRDGERTERGMFFAAAEPADWEVGAAGFRTHCGTSSLPNRRGDG